MALDGETNLKMKRPLVQLAEACHSSAAISECRARFTVEDPNIDLYNFDGKLEIGAETVPLTNNEIIYRGSVLRNTQAATGTGHLHWRRVQDSNERKQKSSDQGPCSTDYR